MEPPKREQNVSSLSKRGSLLLQKANLLVRRKEEAKSDVNGSSKSTAAHRRRRLKKSKGSRKATEESNSGTTRKTLVPKTTQILKSSVETSQVDPEGLPHPDLNLTESSDLKSSKLHSEALNTDQEKPMLLPYTGKIRNPLIDADSSPHKQASSPMKITSDTPQKSVKNEVDDSKLMNSATAKPVTSVNSGHNTSSQITNGTSKPSVVKKNVETLRPTTIGHSLSRKSLDGTVINHEMASFNSESNTTLHKSLIDDSLANLSIPKDSEKEMLFEFAGLKVHVFHDQLTDKVPEIGASGRMLGHGTLLVFHINNGMMIYLLCGPLFVYPLLPKSKVLRIGFNTFMLPLVNPERYWRITLETDDKTVVEQLECVFKKHISYRKLYQDTEQVSDVQERRSHKIVEQIKSKGVEQNIQKTATIRGTESNLNHNGNGIEIKNFDNNRGHKVDYLEGKNSASNDLISGYKNNHSDYSDYDSSSPLHPGSPNHIDGAKSSDEGILSDVNPLDTIADSVYATNDVKNPHSQENSIPDILLLTPLEGHNSPPLPQATPTPQGTSFLSVAIPESPPSASFLPTVSSSRQTSTPLVDRILDSPVLGLPSHSIHQPRPQHASSTGAWANPFRVEYHTALPRVPSVKSDSLMDSLIDEYEEGMTSSILNISRPLSRPASRLSQTSRASYRRPYATNGVGGVNGSEEGFPTTSLSQYHRAHLARKNSVVSDNGNVQPRGTIVRSRSNQSVASVASGSTLTSIYRLIAERNLMNRLDTDDVRLVRLSRSKSKLPPVLKSAFAAANNSSTRYSNSVVGERPGGLSGDQVYRMLKQAEKPKKQLFLGW